MISARLPSRDGVRRRAAQASSRLRGVPPLESGRPTLLITGSGGKIGGILRSGLADDYAIRGLDVEPGPGVDVVADLRRLDRVRAAFAGVDAVVALAGDPRVEAPWQTVSGNNLAVTLNALEAARLAGVRRFVFASSNHVTGGYELDEPYASIVAGRYDGLDPGRVPQLDASSAIRPDSFYGAGKAASEALARLYSDRHGLQAICLRIGQVNYENRPKHVSHYATLLTHRDLIQLVRRSLTAPDELRFAVYYGVSANTWRFWDLEAPRRELGYEPQDDAERFRPAV